MNALPITETQSAFARRRGVSKAAVAKWKAQGLLSMTADGLVEIEESEWRLEDRPSSNRGGKTKPALIEPVSQRPAAPLSIAQDETPADAAERIVRETGAPYTHAEAVRIKENYLALLRQLEFDQKSGAVVPIDLVIAVLVEQLAKVRNKVLGIAVRVAPRAAILKSSEEVRDLIDTEAALALEELTLDDRGLGLDDLRSVLQERFGTAH